MEDHLSTMTQVEADCFRAQGRAYAATTHTVNAIAITNRLLDELVLVKPKPAGEGGATPLGCAKPQAITSHKKCICCGALAHEVSHD